MSISIETHILDPKDAELKRPNKLADKTTAEFEGLDIGVGVVDARQMVDGIPKEGSRTLIWPLAFEARLDPFEVQRLKTIATALEARVIGVENPGVGMSPDAKTSLAVKADLLKGSFKKAAHAQLGAIQEVVGFAEGEEVELLLFSQGAAEGVAMAYELGHEAHGLKLEIPRVTIIEPVNDQPWNLLGKKGLLAKIGSEEPFHDQYFKDNEPYNWLVLPSDRYPESAEVIKQLKKSQAVSSNLGGAALRRPFMPVLLDAMAEDRANGTTGLSQARVDLIRFSGSQVARPDANIQTLGQLRDSLHFGGEASLTALRAPNGEGHRHPAIHSMPNVDVIVRRFVKAP